jgi:Ser/Thr protein kinase RdoA (MazF antagonist)
MKLIKKDFDKILKDYSIGNYKKSEYMEHIHENNVYILWTNRGKFILKDLINVDFDNYKEQLKFIDFLYSKKIRVIPNVKDKEGREVFTYGKRKIIIQKFKEGIHPKRFSNLLIKDLARNIALMHKASLNSKYKGSKNKKFRLKDLSGIGVGQRIIDIQKKNIKALNDINQNKLRTCRIHGDLCEVNFLTKNHKLVSFIDFDDSDINPIIYELAIFIAHSFIKRRRGVDKEKISTFLGEYEKIIKLNTEERKALYLLIMYRLFGILYWYKKFYPKDKKQAEEFDYGIKRSIDIIKIFGDFRVAMK